MDQGVVIGSNNASVTKIEVEDKLSHSIVPQPENNLSYISHLHNTVTIFQQAQKQGSIGLIAHNYLAGGDFYEINIGDVITLYDGANQAQQFIVDKIERFQALQPDSIHSQFQNLETLDVLSAHELAKQVYGQKDHLILQTCIEKDGHLEWGRLFVTAKPLAG